MYFDCNKLLGTFFSSFASVLRIRDDLAMIDFFPSRKKRGNFFVLAFFCSHQFHKIENYFIFELVHRKKLSQLFPKSCFQALRNMGCGFEIRNPEKTYLGSGGSKSTGSLIRIRNTGSLHTRNNMFLKDLKKTTTKNAVPLVYFLYFTALSGWYPFSDET